MAEPQYTCNICGRPLTKIIRSHGYILCNKHYNQFKKYGKFLDYNPRTLQDKNEFHIFGDITYIDLYDKNCNMIGCAIIDTEDLEKVRYIKWKLSGSGYAMNTPKFSGGSKHMSRVILGTDQFVDHINHNTLDNRKCNLRIVNRSQNQMNANYKGVYKTANGTFYARIKLNQKNISLGTYVFEEEAYWARWYAETILFKEYRYPKPEPNILPNRKIEIKEYVDRKVQRL